MDFSPTLFFCQIEAALTRNALHLTRIIQGVSEKRILPETCLTEGEGAERTEEDTPAELTVLLHDCQNILQELSQVRVAFNESNRLDAASRILNISSDLGKKRRFTFTDAFCLLPLITGEIKDKKNPTENLYSNLEQLEQNSAAALLQEGMIKNDRGEIKNLRPAIEEIKNIPKKISEKTVPIPKCKTGKTSRIFSPDYNHSQLDDDSKSDENCKGWECSVCTLKNVLEQRSCDACGSRRPSLLTISNAKRKADTTSSSRGRERLSNSHSNSNSTTGAVQKRKSNDTKKIEHSEELTLKNLLVKQEEHFAGVATDIVSKVALIRNSTVVSTSSSTLSKKRKMSLSDSKNIPEREEFSSASNLKEDLVDRDFAKEEGSRIKTEYSGIDDQDGSQSYNHRDGNNCNNNNNNNNSCKNISKSSTKQDDINHDDDDDYLRNGIGINEEVILYWDNDSENEEENENENDSKHENKDGGRNKMEDENDGDNERKILNQSKDSDENRDKNEVSNAVSKKNNLYSMQENDSQPKINENSIICENHENGSSHITSISITTNSKGMLSSVWICTSCTLENQIRDRNCSLCGQPKIPKIRKKIEILPISTVKEPRVGEEYQIDFIDLPVARTWSVCTDRRSNCCTINIDDDRQRCCLLDSPYTNNERKKKSDQSKCVGSHVNISIIDKEDISDYNSTLTTDDNSNHQTNDDISNNDNNYPYDNDNNIFYESLWLCDRENETENTHKNTNLIKNKYNVEYENTKRENRNLINVEIDSKQHDKYINKNENKNEYADEIISDSEKSIPRLAFVSTDSTDSYHESSNQSLIVECCGNGSGRGSERGSFIGSECDTRERERGSVEVGDINDNYGGGEKNCGERGSGRGSGSDRNILIESENEYDIADTLLTMKFQFENKDKLSDYLHSYPQYNEVALLKILLNCNKNYIDAAEMIKNKDKNEHKNNNENKNGDRDGDRGRDRDFSNGVFSGVSGGQIFILLDNKNRIRFQNAFLVHGTNWGTIKVDIAIFIIIFHYYFTFYLIICMHFF